MGAGDYGMAIIREKSNILLPYRRKVQDKERGIIQ
jgi:hypothetical protein